MQRVGNGQQDVDTDDEIPSLMCSSPVPPAPLVRQFSHLTNQYCKAIRHIRRFTMLLRRITRGFLPTLQNNDDTDDVFLEQIEDFSRMENELRNEFRRAQDAAGEWMEKEGRGVIDDEEMLVLEQDTQLLNAKLMSAQRKLEQRDALIRSIVQYYNLQH